MDEMPRTPISRTRLLKLGAAAALGIGALPAVRAATSGGGAAGAVTPERKSRPVDGPRHLRLATYRPLVGDTFRIRRPGARPLSVKLVSAEPLPGEGETFSLIFRGHRGAKLDQSTYTFEHARLGSYPLFLVPVGPGVRGQDLQVIVNRLPSPQPRG
jgi:hypothetical protein